MSYSCEKVVTSYFKQLLIWQKGMEIWKMSCQITKDLPPDERFGLISQINRAAASIPANIAEGSGRVGKKDYSRFIQIALGSSFELDTFFLGIIDLDLISKKRIDPLLILIDEEQKMLMSFQRKLEAHN